MDLDSTMISDINIKSDCVDVGGDDCLNKVSPYDDPTVELIIAKERLKRLDHDYERIDKKYMETKSQWRGFSREVYQIESDCQRIVYCIGDCKRLIKMLQMALHKLSFNSTSKVSETCDRSLHLSMIHGNKSLAQERNLLRQKTHRQVKKGDEQSQENIDFKWIKSELSYLQRTIPMCFEKKRIRDLLTQVKETKKSLVEAIASDALKNDSTNQESLIKAMENGVKVLEKLIGEIEKERGERELACKIARRKVENAEKKMRKLQKDREEVCGRWDEERKRILKLSRK